MRKKFEYVILLLAVLGVLVANNELRANDTHDYGFYWFDANNQSTDAVNSSGVPNTVSTAFYDPAKPTVFYFHGWQKGTSVKSYSRETFLYADPTTKTNVNTVAKWKADGWNVAIFYWNQMADEDEVKDAEAKIWSTSGPKGMRYRISTGAYGTAFTPTKSVGALALAEYTALMANYKGTEIRFAGHSLGSQLATNLAKLVSDYVAANTTKAFLMPKRLELLDPYWSKDGKSYFGDVYGSSYASCNPATKDGKLDWNAEVVRCHIYNMINKNGLLVTWYKTSAIFDVWVGDQNTPLESIVALQNPASFWLNATDQTNKHVWARHLYFYSKIVSPTSVMPKECTISGTGTRTATGKITIYANTPSTRVKEMMGNTYYWTQVEGRNTPNPNDDWYERKTR
jgi:hypothetical protein